MSETSEYAPQSVAAAGYDENRRDRRLQRTLAWVGIVAGVVFIVAVIFFAGLALGRASSAYGGWHRGYQGGQMGPGGCPMMGGPMMGGQGPMGGPGMMRPGQPTTPTPAPAPPQR